MKKNIVKKILLVLLTCSVIVMSCSRKKSTDSTISASQKIKESENLTIPVEVDLPANPPLGNMRVATYYAEGVQKYKAQAKAGTSPVAYEWAFVAPQATLYDSTNKKVGVHGAGPFWTIATTDSIFAQAFTPAKTATPTAGSIAWLLLMPKSGKSATGIFADVIYIQRIATTGGVAPATPPKNLTDTVDVSYTAVYRFSKKKL